MVFFLCYQELKLVNHGVNIAQHPAKKKLVKNTQFRIQSFLSIDIEYNKRLDRQRPCLEGDFNGGSNNIVQSNKYTCSALRCLAIISSLV